MCLKTEKWGNFARETGESVCPSSVNRGAPQDACGAPEVTFWNSALKCEAVYDLEASWFQHCRSGVMHGRTRLAGLPQQISIKWHLPIPAFYECKDQNSVHRWAYCKLCRLAFTDDTSHRAKGLRSTAPPGFCRGTSCTVGKLSLHGRLRPAMNDANDAHLRLEKKLTSS